MPADAPVEVPAFGTLPYGSVCIKDGGKDRRRTGFVMKKKLIFGLALLFLATAYTFAQEFVDLRFVDNFTNAQYEAEIQAWLANPAIKGRAQPTKAPNYIMGILNSRLNQYNVSTGDTFMLVYNDSPYYSIFIILRFTNAKNREYQYKVFRYAASW